MRKLTPLFWLAAILSATALVYANLDGPPPGHTGAPGEATCNVTGCHDTPSARTGHAHVLPTYEGHGDTISLRLQLFYYPANGSVENFGFQLTTLDSMGQPFGQILVSDSIRTKLSVGFAGRGYLSHTAAGVAGPICVWCTFWNFLWVRPSGAAITDPIYFYISGLLADGDGTPANDALVSTTAVGPCAVPEPAT